MKMTVKITKPVQGGMVSAIASKSAAHRLLICAALADAETFVTCLESSEDIDATARCLAALGAEINYEDNGFFVKPIKENNQTKNFILDCGESGSTLRFMLPVCGALGVDVSFEMGGRLPARPLTGLYEEMAEHGCILSAMGSSPFMCKGLLGYGSYSLPGDVSSQFVSGLLFALPLLDGDSQIFVEGGLESRPYVDMTLDALSLFGIEVMEEQVDELLIFHVKGGQAYCSPKTVRAEGDWSNAAFWLCAGAIGTGGVTVSGLNINSRQGDSAIIELLTRFGAKLEIENNSISVSYSTLSGIKIDATNTPDLVPILAAVATVAQGETVIYNAQRLRIKESDRLKTVAETLSQLGADITETDDGLIIRGKNKLNGGEVHSFGDHRIAMTSAILSAVCEGQVTIYNAEAVRKSYPAFFADFVALGGKCDT